MNAVAYTRYSCTGQNEQSIDGQLRDIYAYAAREGYQMVGEYCDKALTGRSDDRPDFQRMIKDAAKKQFQYIIVWKLDRFSRNRFDSAIYKAQLKKYGVRVISATESISDDPEGIMMEGFLETLAEYYSVNLSKHVKRGMREGAIRGNYQGGGTPLGYKVENRRLVANDNTAWIVRYAFEQYAAGVPKTKIIAALAEKGVRNSSGKLPSNAFLQGVLRNPKYIGKYTIAGQEVAGGCESLVDVEIFERVQTRLDSVKHAPAAQKARQEYLLQGKAFCGHCGTRLVGECGRSSSGQMFHYYACGKKKKERTCKKKNERKDYLEWYVTEQTQLYVLAPERIDYIARRIVEEYDKNFNDNRVKELERRIDRLDREINDAVDASIAAPAKMRQKFYDKMEQLGDQKEDAELDLVRLRIANGIRYTEEMVKDWLKLFEKGDPIDPVFQRRLIDVFVNRIYLYDNKLVIYYNINGGKQVNGIEDIDPDQLPPGEGDEACMESSDFAGNGVPKCRRPIGLRHFIWGLRRYAATAFALIQLQLVGCAGMPERVEGYRREPTLILQALERLGGTTAAFFSCAFWNLVLYFIMKQFKTSTCFFRRAPIRLLYRGE